MRCPACGAEISDPLAAFCPRCAEPLGDEAGEATTRLDVPVKGSGDTSTLPVVDATPARAPVVSAETEATEAHPTEDPAVADAPADESPIDAAPVEHKESAALQRAAEIRTRLESGGWLDAAAAAGLGFLVVLAVGALLVLAAKLNFPQLGGGSDPLSAFNAVVMAGLGSMGVPIVVDGVTVWALPFGALAVVGVGIVWAVQTSLREHRFPSVLAAILHGAKVGVTFALLCWFFAMVFRVRGQHPVASDAGIALVAGGFWGALFGALGAVRVMEKLRTAIGRVTTGIKARDRNWFEGATAGGVMLVAAAVLGAAMTLLWIIVALAKGAPGNHFGAGDAFAYVVYLAAFLPNIIVAIVSMSVGAPVDVGAKIDIGGNLLGPLREYSLVAWGRGDPPGPIWVLILIPLVACIIGGLFARRRATDPKTMVPVLLTASAVFAVTLTLLGAMGPVRMAGVLKGSGYAFIAPDAVLVFLFSFLVSGILGAIGWKLADSPVLTARFPQAS
jgi:hypothetical protein